MSLSGRARAIPCLCADSLSPWRAGELMQDVRGFSDASASMFTVGGLAGANHDDDTCRSSSDDDDDGRQGFFACASSETASDWGLRECPFLEEDVEGLDGSYSLDFEWRPPAAPASVTARRVGEECMGAHPGIFLSEETRSALQTELRALDLNTCFRRPWPWVAADVC
eukprot:CAMPEP_0183412246 /NCGR_PEP_ID=MMETSP0370-20130417/20888_1 /TAXON_ID=268820 /ORGANISM="Peridinium aciculiferum, Strain PAER-2" /LENGTH=167 /DNA_ID=CAMNT_0025595325 /DNA_START=69 /DNA_END=572 /DNA_ORIENTATION=-